MKTPDNEPTESAWHLQIINDCDDILKGLDRVIGNLRKQRRHEFRNPRGLGIFQESWSVPAAVLERSEIA